MFKRLLRAVGLSSARKDKHDHNAPAFDALAYGTEIRQAAKPAKIARLDDPEGYPVGLVGESFYQPAIRKLKVGDVVEVRPEPTNPHDPEAIVVIGPYHDVIGYIPRHSFLKRVIYKEGGSCSAYVLSINRAKGEGPSHLGVVIQAAID